MVDKLQAQLVMASKMESIGRLAGGIAHDFNNMLLVILGSAERELARTDLDAPQREALSEIQKAALRSSDLTRQLVAFARSQIIAPKVLDLDQTVEGTLKAIHHMNQKRDLHEKLDLLLESSHAEVAAGIGHGTHAPSASLAAARNSLIFRWSFFPGARSMRDKARWPPATMRPFRRSRWLDRVAFPMAPMPR